MSFIGFYFLIFALIKYKTQIKLIMCGIVGYIGPREAYPIIIEGLKRLEYRGYDSAGIALFDGTDLNVCKTKGKVADLENKFED